MGGRNGEGRGEWGGRNGEGGVSGEEGRRQKDGGGETN